MEKKIHLYEVTSQLVYSVFFLILFGIAEIIARKKYNFSLANYILETLKESSTTAKTRKQKQRSIRKSSHELIYKCGCVLKKKGSLFVLNPLCPTHYKEFYAKELAKEFKINQSNQTQYHNTRDQPHSHE